MSDPERLPLISDDDLDVSEFHPTRAHRPDVAATREIAAKQGFADRDAKPPQAPASTPAAAGQGSSSGQRRYRTGRNVQMSIKITEDVQKRFYAIVDRHNWILGDAFARAVEALEEKLGEES